MRPIVTFRRLFLAFSVATGGATAVADVLIYSDGSGTSRQHAELQAHFYAQQGETVVQVSAPMKFAEALLGGEWTRVKLFARYTAKFDGFAGIEQFAAAHPKVQVQGFFWHDHGKDVDANLVVRASEVGVVWQYGLTSYSYANVKPRRSEVKTAGHLVGTQWPSFTDMQTREPFPLRRHEPMEQGAGGACADECRDDYVFAINECEIDHGIDISNCHDAFPSDPPGLNECLVGANNAYTNCLNTALYRYNVCLSLCAAPAKL